MVNGLHVKKILYIFVIIVIVFSGCTAKDIENSSSTDASSNDQGSYSSSSDITESSMDDELESSDIDSGDGVDPNDYESYTQSIYDAIRNFDWVGYEGKQFLHNEGNEPSEYEIYIADINNDNMGDIIVSRIYDNGEMPSNEVFIFNGSEILSVGGYYGAINETEGEHNSETKNGNINLFKNSNGEGLFIQWAKSKLNDTNLVLCEVFVDTIIYNPVVGVHSNDQNRSYYNFNDEFPNSAKEFIVEDFWEVLQPISKEEYDSAVSRCENDLELIRKLPYEFILSYNLQDGSINSKDIAEKICEKMQSFL